MRPIIWEKPCMWSQSLETTQLACAYWCPHHVLYNPKWKVVGGCPRSHGEDPTCSYVGTHTHKSFTPPIEIEWVLLWSNLCSEICLTCNSTWLVNNSELDYFHFHELHKNISLISKSLIIIYWWYKHIFI